MNSGLTYHPAINPVVEQLRNKTTPISPLTRRAILSDAGAGLGIRVVAAKAGVSHTTVLRVWKRAGIDPQRLAVRNAMVVEHKWLAERVAKSVAREVPAQMRGELEGVAYIALTQAAGSFDATRGVAFPLYAQQRIRGACLDSIRRRHWTNGTATEHTREDAEARQDHEPNAADRVISLEMRQKVLDALANLPGRYAVLLFLHYIEERSLEAIAPTLGVGASRLSQMHREGLAMLREKMA